MNDFKSFVNSESSECVDSKDIKVKLEEMEAAYVKNTDNSESFACVGSEDIRIKEEDEENTRTSMDAGISEENANLCKVCSKICYLKDLNEKFVCRECCPLENMNSDLEQSNTAEESESYNNVEIIKVEEPTISNAAISYQAILKLDFKANRKLNVDKYFKKLKDSYICIICPEEKRRTHKTTSMARNHIKMIHFDHKFECRECTAKYTSRKSIKNHYKIQHGKEEGINIVLTNYEQGYYETEDHAKLDVNEHVKKLGDSYICGLCPEFKCMRYSASSAVQRHIKIIHYGHRFACPECNEKYLTSVSVKSHYKKVHVTKDAATLHVELTGGDKLLPISYELLKDPRDSIPKDLNAEKLSAFIKKVNNTFICTLCPKNKSLHHKSLLSVRFHLRYIHFGYGYKCPECSKNYANTKDLKRHYKNQHHMEAPTTIKLKRSLEPSVRSNHTTKKQIRKVGNLYICAVCPKTKTKKYINISSIRRHIKIRHQGYRYECSVCSAKYTLHTEIQRHYGVEHNQVAGIKFMLTKHFRHGLPTKQQQAENELKQSFTSQTGYLRKQLKCNGGSYYFCTLCSTEKDKSQKYKQLKTIERHIKIRHQRYRYHCTECSHKYSNIKTLRKHYKKKHKIEAPKNIALTKVDDEE